jgi:AraC family transcriptional regulator
MRLVGKGALKGPPARAKGAAQTRKTQTAPVSTVMSFVSEFSLPVAKVQLVRFEARNGLDHVIHDPSAHWVDLSVTDRASDVRGCYVNRWNPHRFERVGPMFVVPQGQKLRLKSETRVHSSIVCRLHGKAMKEWLGSDLEWSQRRLEASLDVSNADIRRLMRKLAHEIRYPGPAFLPMMEMLAGEIAIEIARYFTAIDTPAAIGGLAAWRLRAIDERVMEARKAPTLSELAAFCSMSPRQLTRGFRASRGCSLGDYISQIRIDTAKRLLAGDESISEISERLGFSSLANFSFAFRRGAGVPPRQYRARMMRERIRS